MLKVLILSSIKLQSKYVLFYILLCSSSAYMSCQSQQSCNSGDRIRCGICVETTKPKGKNCIFPFSLLYKPDKSCPKAECENNCNGNGYCQRTGLYYKDMFPRCNCYKGFYGSTCKHAVSSDVAGIFFRYVEFPYKNIQAPAEDSAELIYFWCDSNEEGWGSIEIVSEDEGYYLQTSINRQPCKYRDWVKKMTFKTRFPYKPPSHAKTLKLGDDVLGYLSSFRITITLGRIINFQHSYPVFVSYEEVSLKCVPVVNILGCPPSKIPLATISRSHYIKIVSNVVFYTNGKYASTTIPQHGCANSATYLWRMWRNVDLDTNTTYRTILDAKKLEFEPFDLEIGNYRILLEVTTVQDKPSMNYAYCYFGIAYEPFVAIIDGGSERMVQKNLGFFLTTTRSGDPNMPSYNQSHMKASWSCIDISDNNKEICNPLNVYPVSNTYFVPPEKLNFGAVLKITLNIYSDYYNNCTTCLNFQPAFAYATIVVGNQSTGDDYIYLQCLNNCKERVVASEQLYLKVKTRSGTYSESYVWTYSEKALGNEKSTDGITLQGLPNFMFVAKQNAFSVGKNYIISVKNKKDNLLAKYAFQTVDVRFEGNCSMNPMNGTKGLSKFSIVCQNFKTNGRSLLYEFYDKSSEEAEEGLLLSGRMMGTSRNGELCNIRVTKGQVFVYIKDNSGLYTHKQFNVSLSDWNVTEEVLEKIFKNITEAKEQNNFAKMMEYISIIPDIVPNEFNKSKILERLLYLILDSPINILSDVKITSSSLINIIMTLNKPVYLKVEPGLMQSVVSKIQSQLALLSSTVGKGTDLQGMCSDEIKQLTTALLTCIYTILMCKDPSTVEVNELNLDFETEDKLMHISNSVIEGIYLIQNVLTFLQRPGLPPINITSKDKAFTVSVVINDEDYDLTNYLDVSNGLYVSVSKNFLKEFKKPIKKTVEYFVLRTAILDNIFWWRKSNVKSNLVLVSLVKQLENERLSKIKAVNNSLDIQINLTNRSLVNTTEISAITFQYQYNNTCSLDLDMAVKIHRLDPAPQSLISLKFLFPQTNGSLLVLILKDHRPECDMMKKAVTISDQSPNYPPLLVLGDEPSFYYIGIIPGYDYINDSVRYTFQVNTTACQHWERGYWSAQGCKISDRKTKDLKVHCNCDRFSIFAAAFIVPPQKVDPFSDISLFLTVFDNPIVVIFVSVTLLIYLIACLWAFRKDRNDRMLRSVVILADNFPGDCYPYLLAVYTSSRFNAGTTAHVGIQVIGSLATSRTHILRSPERNTLRRNYDDWFLMYYSESLGELKNIHVWHDNAGSSPEWFCDKIVIYDLKHNLDAVFVVEQWLALRINCFPEAIVSAATIGEAKNLKRLFLDNCVLGLREGHLLLSIVLRHPRSVLSRLQKISVLMCCIMVAMLCSIMFYSPQVDEHSYNVGLRDFFISIQTLMISFAITLLVLFVFKKSYKYTHQRNRSTTLYKPSKFQDYDVLKNIHQKNTFYASYVRFVSKRLKGPPLIPVQLAMSKYDIRRRNMYFLFSWFSCIVVIVICSLFVMLYGLKLGRAKSKMWLSAVLLIVSEELFILESLKIIIFSIVLSTAFQTLSETNTHRVNLVDVLKLRLPAEVEEYEKLSLKRNHPMYIPLRHDDIDEMIRKKKLWNYWRNLIDFVVSLCFLMVLSKVMYEFWTSHYQANEHLKNLVIQSYHSIPPFSAVGNISQMENYLRLSWVRSLYTTLWYNNDAISEGGVVRGFWIDDFTHRKIGLERLRQIRVTSVECTFKFINTTQRCIPRWDSDYEDTQDYSVGWGDTQWKNLQENNSLWKYTKSSLSTMSTMYRLYGESGTLYHDGGYLTHLGPNRLSTESTITDSISDHWQDQLTRAVFVEFTLFNINQDLFSQVTLIVEYLISGNIKLNIEVLSVDSKIKLNNYKALLVVLIIYYLVRSGVQINRQGLMEFLNSSLNQTQVLVLALSVLCFVVATVHYFYSAAEFEDFIERGQSSFFDFDSFVFYFMRLHDMCSLLFCVAILHSVLILREGRSFVNYFYTLTSETSCVIYLTVVILLILLLQLHFMFLLYIYSFDSIEDVIINHWFVVPDNYKYISTAVLFSVKSLFVSVMLKFYFLIFTHSFRIARTRKVNKPDNFNFLPSVFDEIRKCNRK